MALNSLCHLGWLLHQPSECWHYKCEPPCLALKEILRFRKSQHFKYPGSNKTSFILLRKPGTSQIELEKTLNRPTLRQTQMEELSKILKEPNKNMLIT